MTIPLGGSGDGTTELVLHEARAFTAYRESWVVRADGDGSTATTALPEVKILLSESGTRIRSTAPALATLLTHLGATLTFTAAPPGSGRRMGIDRDEDGYPDGDERSSGTDPADPSSHP